jgi:uncharacterized protein
MTYRTPGRDEHLFDSDGPKRILALDGGGLRGILTLGILERVEQVLRARHGDAEGFRLCHYFDLIAGTSTGAIIAAALATGWTVAEVRDRYFAIGSQVFQRTMLRDGLVRARYNKARLIAALKQTYGENTKLGGPEILTGLLVIMKRIDTGSVWPVSNNPRNRYFATSPTGTLGNGDFPLWQVVRASTAAPSYFEPESITISDTSTRKPASGQFVDGGMSPFNNPALQAFMYSTISGYGLGWPTGADKMLLVSVGTGAADPTVKQSLFAGGQAVSAFLSLMNDCAALQEMMLQWMSASDGARRINRDVDDLSKDLVAGTPLLRYARFNVDLRAENVKALDPTLESERVIHSLSEMDAPENMTVLYRLGVLAAQRDVTNQSIPPEFDLR